MSLTINQQIFEQIKKSQRILIAFKQNFSGDALASSLALFLFLQKMDKKVDIVCQDFVLPANFSFLPSSGQIKPALSGLQNFVISLDTTQNKIKNLAYENKDNVLNIYLTPQNNNLNPQDITLQTEHYKYDLIITLDSDDLESLGEVYKKNADFFFNTPIINICHNPANEQYGQINLADSTRTSVAETIFTLIEEYNINLLDQEIATCLLCGMIAQTKSFSAPNLTPRALTIASQLIINGADRDLIIQNLYRTKSINTLKLWGKVLARLKFEPAEKIAWSYLTQKDFIELNAPSSDLSEVIEELISCAPEAKIVVIFYENEKRTISGLVYSSSNYDSLFLTQMFNPSGDKNMAKFEINNNDLALACGQALEQIKKAANLNRF